MAYEVVMPYHLHMPSYFLETFTEYPWIGRFSFDTLPFLVSDSLCLEHSYRACIVSTSFAVCH